MVERAADNRETLVRFQDPLPKSPFRTAAAGLFANITLQQQLVRSAYKRSLSSMAERWFYTPGTLVRFQQGLPMNSQFRDFVIAIRTAAAGLLAYITLQQKIVRN